jgi:hypothetical protein
VQRTTLELLRPRIPADGAGPCGVPSAADFSDHFELSGFDISPVILKSKVLA